MMLVSLLTYEVMSFDNVSFFIGCRILCLALADIQLRLRNVEIARANVPIGVSTEANWVADLRQNSLLINSDLAFTTFLTEHAVKWWITPDVVDFPPVGAAETAICQPFVTDRLTELELCRGRVYPPKLVQLPGTSRYKAAYKNVNIHCQVIDAHGSVSYSGRRPDIVCYDGHKRGAYSIVMLGEVKGCGTRHADFPEAAIGKILDMASDLLIKHQFNRAFMYCFLTDGCKFQFFKCTRTGNVLTFQQSPVYLNEHGWQVCIQIHNVMESYCIVYPCK